jgi:predicted permease
MARLFRRIWFLIRGRRLEAELREEIELHGALTRARLERAGMSADEAAARSRRTLGNVTLAREDARAAWIPVWLDSVRQDVSYALRILRRSPSFAASMILVMALGIGATTGVFSLLDGLLLRSLPVHDPARLVYLSRPSFSYPIFTELRTRAPHVVSGLFAWNLDRVNVAWTTELEPADVLMASGDFYAVLGVGAALGRTLTPGDDRIGGGPDGLVAVISHKAWQRRFGGEPAVIGRTIRIQRQPFTIVGVTPPRFFGVAPGLAPEVTIPLTSLQDAEALEATTSAWLHLMGRLPDGVPIDRANAALQSIWPAVLEVTTRPGMPADRRAMYLSRTTWLESARAGYSRVRNQFEEPLWLLLTLGGLLLSVATASAAHLLLARSAARRREFAVRLAIGAGRARVMRQMLTEALVWTLLGAAAGLLVARWGSRVLIALMTTWEDPIALDVSPNGRILLFTLGLTLVTTCLCAVLPARRATRASAVSMLKEFGGMDWAGSRRWSPGASLVSAQVALTVVLLFGAVLFGRSLQRILSQDAGFDRDPILVVSAEARAAGYEGGRHAVFYADLLDRLRALPGAESASLSWYPPVSDQDGAWTQSLAADGGPLQQDPLRQVYFNAVSPGYFRTMGIRLLQGRDFAVSDGPASGRVVILNETLAHRLFPRGNPLGHRVGIGRHATRQELEIVGVVSDAKYQDLREPTRGVAFLPCAQLAEFMGGEDLFAEVRAIGPLGRVAEDVRRAVRLLDAAVPIRMQTIDDRIRESLVTERVIAILAGGLGIGALALACASLYGLLAYSVSRRTGEIGLRLALGARPSDVLWMVLRQSLVLGVVGTAAGLAAAIALGRLARNVLYQVSETDAIALAASAGVMLTVALCAGWFPARQAAAVDPAAAMKHG